MRETETRERESIRRLRCDVSITMLSVWVPKKSCRTVRSAGFGLISTYAFRGNQMAIQKGAMIRNKLVAFQVPLGGLAIVTSVLYGVLHFV